MIGLPERKKINFFVFEARTLKFWPKHPLMYVDLGFKFR